MTTINNYTLNYEAEAIAESVLQEVQEYGTDAYDLLHEMCDGHEWVIYTYKAFQVCAECNTDDGEDYLEGLGQSYTDIGRHATAVAYATLMAKATEHYNELTNEGEHQ